MKGIVCILGLFLCLNGALSDECLEEGEKTKQCIMDLMKDVMQNSEFDAADDEMKCSFIDGASECAKEFVESCNDPESKGIMQELIKTLEEQYEDDKCSAMSTREMEILKCASDEEKLLEYVGTCVLESVGDKDLDNADDDDTCEIFLSMAECTSTKLANDCGEELEGPFMLGMMLALKEHDPDVAESPRCKEKMTELEQDLKSLVMKRKRRSLREVNFRRFVSMI